jgi:hypothetical protein
MIKEEKKKMRKNLKDSIQKIVFWQDRVYEEKTSQNVALYYNIIIKASQ